jgi:DNA-directed RNA polymerase specialized sigma24 family protein
MDQVDVEAPAVGSRPSPLVQEFYSDFSLVLNYVARLIDNVEDTPGITCEAFRDVMHRLPHAPDEAAVRVEVFRAATSLSREALRPHRWFRRRRHPNISLESFPEAEARRTIRRDTMQRALGALPFEARAVVLLRDFAKLSYEDLAQVIDIPPKKLVHVLDRSRAELNEIYDYIKF